MVEEKYLTTKETSTFLRISVSTLNRLVRQNKIPFYKVSHRRLFDKHEVVQWVRTQASDRRGKRTALRLLSSPPVLEK
jgi:excisionase family DNA binding protein